MPTEVRQIIFQTNEVVAAIREYRRRHNLSLPTGRVHAVNIKAAGIAVLGSSMAPVFNGKKSSSKQRNFLVHFFSFAKSAIFRCHPPGKRRSKNTAKALP
jgi:hypothetical protein